MNAFLSNSVQYILGMVLILSALGVICAKKPVHASISFLLSLFTLATIYLQLHAEFIAVMQVLVYAGAILVIFMYVIILFQDAYLKIPKTKPQSSLWLLAFTGCVLMGCVSLIAQRLMKISFQDQILPEGFGTVQSIGLLLYSDFFFPFEAIILLFLIAVVGSVYTAKKGF